MTQFLLHFLIKRPSGVAQNSDWHKVSCDILYNLVSYKPLNVLYKHFKNSLRILKGVVEAEVEVQGSVCPPSGSYSAIYCSSSVPATPPLLRLITGNTIRSFKDQLDTELMEQMP